MRKALKTPVPPTEIISREILVATHTRVLTALVGLLWLLASPAAAQLDIQDVTFVRGVDRVNGGAVDESAYAEVVVVGDGITDVGDGGLRQITRKLVCEFLGGLNPAKLRRPRPCQGADEILWRALAGLQKEGKVVLRIMLVVVRLQGEQRDRMAEILVFYGLHSLVERGVAAVDLRKRRS